MLRRAGEDRRPLSPVVEVVIAAIVALSAGALIGRGTTSIAFLIALAIVGIALFDRMDLPQWGLILVFSTVVVRAPTAFLGLPPILNYLHFAVVGVFLARAMQEAHGSPSKAERGIRRWLVYLSILVLASMTINASHPIRALLFFTILAEPIAVVWGMILWPHRALDDTTMLKWGAAILVIQIPLAAYQAVTVGVFDPVVGTLINHGAGSHILGALFALLLLVIAAGVASRRVPVLLGAVVGVGAIAMMVLSGAIQVLIAVGVALIVLPFVSRVAPGDGRQNPVSVRAKWAILTLAILVPPLLLAGPFLTRYERRIDRLIKSQQWPEVGYLADRGSADPIRLMLGDGPGTTASRASLLLTPEMLKEDSPLTSFNLPATEAGLKLVAETRGTGGGSAESFASSSVGIMGDLGVLGYLLVIALFISLWRQLGRSESWLAPACRGALIMVAIISFIDNWLEYPEFTLPLALLIGLSLRGGTPVHDHEGWSVDSAGSLSRGPTSLIDPDLQS